MPRTRRAAIDQDADWIEHDILSNDDAVLPGDDYTEVTASVPIWFSPTEFFTSFVIWGNGVVSFGAVTQAQIDFMNAAGPGTNMLDFPGPNISLGYQDQAFEIEFGTKSNLTIIYFDNASVVIRDHILELSGTYAAIDLPNSEGGLTVYPAIGGVIDMRDFVVFDGTGGADQFSGSNAPQTVNLFAGNDVASAGSGAVRLFGGDGDDILAGGSGIDLLDGGRGVDHIVAGLGDTVRAGADNDFITYTGSTSGIADLIDGGLGFDTLTIELEGVTQPAALNLPERTLDGQAFAQNFINIEATIVVGSRFNDRLTGGSGSEELRGGGGSDVLIGGDGADILDGGEGLYSPGFTLSARQFAGTGIDEYFTVSGSGDVPHLAISGFTGPFDGGSSDSFILNVSATGDFSILLTDGDGDISARLVGPSDSFFFDAFNNDPVVLDPGQYTLTINNNDASFSGESWDAGITLSSANVPLGNQLIGGAGNDNYRIHHAEDRVVEAVGEGNDRVVSSISYVLTENVERLALAGTAAIDGTGNELANAIGGNSANNVLDGMAGADHMAGQGGSDTYHVDNAGDRVVEQVSNGNDRVISSISYVLGDNVERLALAGTAAINGTGNGLANAISGNAGNNKLDGMAGADRMAGKAGSDTYYVDDAGDVVFELTRNGNDRVVSSISYQLGANVERLALAGTAAIDGTGNELANAIRGNAGNNVINGMAGADHMSGLGGNDIYYVDNARDRVVEFGGNGIDRVISSINYELDAHVDRLTLAGTASINGTGNGLANTLVGNAGNNVLNGMAGADYLVGRDGDDTLSGGSGNDKLEGGTGDDIYYFADALGPNNIDSILGFSASDDSIHLDDSIFGGLALGALAAGAFNTGTAASEADDRIIYDPVTGRLLFDADGNGAGAAVHFATLDPGLAVSAADFFVV